MLLGYSLDSSEILFPVNMLSLSTKSGFGVWEVGCHPDKMFRNQDNCLHGLNNFS